MLARIFLLRNSKWRRVTLKSLTWKYRTPKVLDEEVRLKGCQKALRQLTIMDLGHEEPTILLRNDLKSGRAARITSYAQRMFIALYRLLAERLPEDYRRAQAKTILDNLLGGPTVS